MEDNQKHRVNDGSRDEQSAQPAGHTPGTYEPPIDASGEQREDAVELKQDGGAHAAHLLHQRQVSTHSGNKQTVISFFLLQPLIPTVRSVRSSVDRRRAVVICWTSQKERSDGTALFHRDGRCCDFVLCRPVVLGLTTVYGVMKVLPETSRVAVEAAAKPCVPAIDALLRITILPPVSASTKAWLLA